MKIAYPVTDYIRASVLTTQGDMVVRGAADPQRIASGGNKTMIEGRGGAALPVYHYLDGLLNLYVKGQGLNTVHKYEALRLRDTGIFIGNSMRNSAGAQVISGIGFESSVVIFIAVDDTGANQNWSVGFDNGITAHSILSYTNGTEVGRDVLQSLVIHRDGVNRIQGHITTIGANGFTITWTIVGACVADFVYLCLP